MKAYGGVDVQIHIFLTSAPVGGEWSALRPGRFTPGKELPGSNPDLIMWDFVMDKSGAGAGFLRELRFPLPIYNPPASPQSSSLSPEAGTIGQAGVAAVPIASPKKYRIPGKIFRVQTGRIPSWTYSKADVYRGTTVISFCRLVILFT
jgi:hypothetical protein